MVTPHCSRLFPVVAAVLVFVVAADAGGRFSAKKVKVSAKAGPVAADGTQRIDVKIDIEPGWYIYANPVGDDLFASNATKVIVKSGGKSIPAKVVYPKGKVKSAGKITYRIYQGSVTIPVIVRRSGGTPLEITVQVNACDKNRCLPAGKKTVVVR